jgi:L1 cell adhesion molecule like protein
MTIFACDLGTTYSAASVWKNERVEIIQNTKGNRTTPSYVAFTDTDRLIGDSARNQAAINPLNTIYDVKRLIGKKYSDPSVQEDIKLWPFKVEDDGNDRPQIAVQYKGQEHKFYAEEISAMILGYMKEIAEAFTGETMNDIVITVPAYFNDSARQSTKDAATIAGLNAIRIINEPTAAAISYGLDHGQGTVASTTADPTAADPTADSTADPTAVPMTAPAKRILIVDIGGGTSDFTVLIVDDGIFQVKSTSGLSHTGGEDFDNRLVKYFTDEFQRKYAKDLSSNPKSVKRLKNACERAKRDLSSSSSTTIDIDSLYDGIDFTSIISRSRFDELCMDLFQDCMSCIEKALKDSGFNKKEIDDVVIVGGSSRIPRIQQLISEYFGGKELCRSLNPDEAIAYGAAVQAAILGGCNDDEIKNVLLLDVCPLTLSIRTAGDVATPVIERNTTIPVKKTRMFSTYADDQDIVDIEICEGERTMFNDNHFLGNFHLLGFHKAKRGEPKIEVTFDIDANGILIVSAEEKSSHIKKSLKITNDTGRISASEIELLIKDAEKFREEDKANRERIDARNELETYLLSVKNSIVEDKDVNISGKDRKKIHAAVTFGLLWLDENRNATKQEYEEKREESKDMVNPFISKLYKDLKASGNNPADEVCDARDARNARDADEEA